MRRDQALNGLRRRVPALRVAGVQSLSLFGSTARDEAGQDSGVDVLVGVDLDANRRLVLLALIGVQHRIESELGQPVHATLGGPMTVAMRASIVRDSVAVF